MVLQKYKKGMEIDKHDPRLHTAFYVILAFIMVLGVVNSVFSLAAFGIFAIYVLLAKPKNIFFALFFLMPFAGIFKITSGSTSLFTYIQLIAFAKLMFYSKKINGRFMILWLLFFAFLLMGSNMNYTVLIKQAIILPLIYFFFAGEKPDIKSFTLNYANGLLLSSLIAQFNDSIPNMSKYIVNDMTFELADDVERFSALYSDPNYYTLALILALSSILILYSHKLIGSVTYVYYAFIAFFGAQTVSKSFFLLFAFLSLFFIFVLIQNRKYKATLAFLIFLAIGSYLVFSGRFAIFDNVLERFNAPDSNDITTGRSTIWQRYFEYFSENTVELLFGSGIGASYLRTAAHNTYIDFIYYYGIFGSALFFVVLFTALEGLTKFKKTMSNYFPLICVLINFAFLSNLLYYDFLFTLIFVIFIFSYNFNKSERPVDYER